MSSPSTPLQARVANRTVIGILLGVAASLSFATSGPFVKPLFEAGWTPGAAVFWRVLGATCLLLPVGLWLIRGSLRDLLREWRSVLGFGALAVGAAQLMFFAAVSRMDVSIALLIEYMAPVLLVGIAWARTRRPPSGLVVAGAVSAVVGLLCVLDLAGAHPDPLGILFGCGAMIGAAAYFTLSARPNRLPPIALAGAGLAVGSVVLGLAILVGILPYAAPLGDVWLIGSRVPWWLPLGVVIVAATTLAYAFGVAGTALMGERLGSFVSLSEVLFAALLAAVVLGEMPSTIQMVGGVLVILGVVLIRLADTPTEMLPDEAAEPA